MQYESLACAFACHYTEGIILDNIINMLQRILRTPFYLAIVVLPIMLLAVCMYAGTLHAQTAPTIPAEGALGAPCPIVNSGDSIPTGFGAPYNLFSSSKELLFKPFCTSSGFVARFGYDTAGTVAIYRSGYRWDGTRWSSMSFSADGGITSGSYIIGKAKSSTQRYATTTNTTFIAFTCTYVGSAWKCGCRDTSCATPYWQIQSANNIFAWDVAVTTSLSSVEKGKGFNVTYTNNGDQPISNCPGKAWLEYQSGSSWKKFSLKPVNVTSTSCLSTLLAAGSHWTVSFVLPSSATAGTWRAVYGTDSSHTFYSPNFTLTAGSCTSNCEPPPPNNPPGK